MSSVSDGFALDRSLLNRDFPTSQWGNLGLWAGTTDYAAACEALAIRLAEAAGLRAGSRVLDVGFGHGDQLLVWKQRFEVGPVTGVEVDARGLAEAQRRLAAFPDVALGLDHAWPDAHYDTVLALDCAYHFAHRQALFGRVLQALKPSGVLALTDLTLAETPGAFARRAIAPLAQVCAIPAENLMTATAYQRQLEGLGFEQVRVERLDGVLDGFASHVFTHQPQPGRWPFSAGWARIMVSAAAARWLTRTDAVRYVIVTAQKSA